MNKAAALIIIWTFCGGFKSSEEMKRSFLILCSVVAVIRVNEEKCCSSIINSCRYPNIKQTNVDRRSGEEREEMVIVEG